MIDNTETSPIILRRPIVLDTGPLGKLAHPRPNADIAAWFEQALSSPIAIYLPEIADYEVRRNFLLEGLTSSLHILDGLKSKILYLPLTTPIMGDAARLWAEARKGGKPTGDKKELDGDVILAAQALAVGGLVVTDNIGHLAQFVEALLWQETVI